VIYLYGWDRLPPLVHLSLDCRAGYNYLLTVSAALLGQVARTWSSVTSPVVSRMRLGRVRTSACRRAGGAEAGIPSRHLVTGSKDGERPWVLEALSALVPHVACWDPDDVDVEISVKDRDGKEQHVTLRAGLPGYSPLVAVAADRNLDRALAEAKRELIRQIEDQKSMREPKHNRQLRKKTT